MPPLSRGSSCRRLRRLLLATALSSVPLAAATFGLGRAAAAGRPPMAAQVPRAAALSLTSQTSWVTSSAGIRLRLGVLSALPDSRLGLNVVLYSRLGSRDAFEETLGGVEPPSEFPLDSPATIPLGAIRHGGAIDLRLPVTTSASAPAPAPAGQRNAPVLSLDCATGTCPGVYPLELVLLDKVRDVPLASLTTYLVYAPPQPGSLPLEVSLVLPVGDRPALAPGGASTLTHGQLTDFTQLLHELATSPRTRVSLAIHGQYLDALARTPGTEGKTLLASLLAIAGGQQPGGSYGHPLLTVPFADAEPDQLAAAGLGSELTAQLAAERTTLASLLHSAPGTTPYVTSGGLDPHGLRLLHRLGVGQVVIPPSSISTTGSTPTSTPIAPFFLTNGPPRAPGPPGGSGATTTPGGRSPTGATEAFLSDPGLAGFFSGSNGDPVLAAHQFLAELASIYFDDPFSTENRGVVVAPLTAGPDARFLATVLSSLGSNQVVRAASLNEMFATIPVGSNGMPARETISPSEDVTSGGLAAGAVRSAIEALQTVASVVPTAKGLSARLEQAILLGQSGSLSGSLRAAYTSAPREALRRIGDALSLTGGRTTTLTSRSGRIPITVVSTIAGPVHVVLRLRSSELTFNGANRSVVEIPLTLTGKASQSDVKVSSRTSGSSTLDVSVLTPRNDVVLVDESIAVHSTAISGVAIVLSLGALLVLLAWWLRSYARHRRRPVGPGGAKDQTEAPASEPAG